jgi:uncharacterized membrane protein
MSSIDTGACVSAAWETFKKNPGNHILALLLVSIGSGVGMGLLTGPLMVGYTQMLMKEQEGQPTTVGDIFKGFDDFVPGLIVGLLGSMIVSFGYMFCIVPGMLLAPLVPFAVYLVAAGEKDGVVALKRAFELLQANLVPAAICSLVLGLVGSLGMLACFVGIFVTLPLTFIGSFHMARQAIGSTGTALARV